MTRFAFEDVGLSKLKAGHAHDNPASGRVLTKLGFSPLDTVQRFSRPRGENIMHRRYVLTSLRLERSIDRCPPSRTFAATS